MLVMWSNLVLSLMFLLWLVSTLIDINTFITAVKDEDKVFGCAIPVGSVVVIGILTCRIIACATIDSVSFVVAVAVFVFNCCHKCNWYCFCFC